MPKGKGKRLVYVPEDLVKEIIQVSRNRGESISKFVEEAIRQALKISEIGYNSKQLADFFQVMQAQRILGGVFVPLDVLSYLTSKTFDVDKEKLQTKWYAAGIWHGKYLKERFEDPVQAFKNFLEVSRWDLSEIEVKKNEGEVKVRCVSTVLTIEGTMLLIKFIEGAMHGIGYKMGKTDYVKGMIALQFKS